MTAGKPKPGVARLSRFVRRWRFDRNPLRRTSDRVETMVLALLIAAFLIGTPFAVLAAGAWAHDASRQAQLDQEASRRQVTAVVLAVTAPVDGAQRLDWQARARWTAPGGQTVTQDVPVPFGTTAGQKIKVWIDLSGDLSTAPLLDSQVTSQTYVAQAFAVLGSGGVLVVAADVILWVLDRRRMAAWAADWQATGPIWTTRA